MNVSATKRAVVSAIAACLAALALTAAVPSGAQAEERQFCWGANVAPNMYACQSGSWYMNAIYGNSLEGPVCVMLTDEGGIYCDNAANQGVYRNQGWCGYSQARIYNRNITYERVYGKFWTC